VSVLLCKRCGTPALVIYEQEPLCGPCALIALDEHHHYLVVKVDDGDPVVEHGAGNTIELSNP
jgi:hypothetical protein